MCKHITLYFVSYLHLHTKKKCNHHETKMPRFFKVNQIETNKPLKEWRRINKAKIGA